VRQPVHPHLLYARIWQNISAASFFRCKLIWGINECVVLPYFNAPPDIFVVTNCCIVALGVVSYDSVTWIANSLYSVQWHTKQGEWMYRKMCMFCQETSPKHWFGNRTMTSNCDVTKTAHQIQMTTHATEWKPLWKFAAYATGYIISKYFKRRNTSEKIEGLKATFPEELPFCCAGFSSAVI